MKHSFEYFDKLDKERTQGSWCTFFDDGDPLCNGAGSHWETVSNGEVIAQEDHDVGFVIWDKEDYLFAMQAPTMMEAWRKDRELLRKLARELQGAVIELGDEDGIHIDGDYFRGWVGRLQGAGITNEAQEGE